MIFSTEWCMPNKWTFQMKPVKAFLERNLSGCKIIVDPFCGTSTLGTHRNDLAESGIDAEEWLKSLNVIADAVIFDPPYSPRQISECYQSIGRKCTAKDTQNAVLYKNVRNQLERILKNGGVALSFGWQSSGFGKKWPTTEIMLVQHGGAHNDTICVAQEKP